MPKSKKTSYFNEGDNTSVILFHGTNRTWETPDITKLGFHAGTLKAAKDRMKSFDLKINPHIKKVEIQLNNPLKIGRDYRFHNDLVKVSNELFKDKIITRVEKDRFIKIYAKDATFEELRNLLFEKYGYDGIIYRNNIEDKGSSSYIAFFKEQIKILDDNFEE